MPGTATLRIAAGQHEQRQSHRGDQRPSRARMRSLSSHACEIDNFAMHVPLSMFAALMRSDAERATALAAPSRESHVAGVSSPDEIEWRVSDAPVPYEEALAFMEQRAAAIRDGTARECVWLLEHPPLFTAGTSADPAELFNPARFPGLRGRSRRPLHLSRPRPARRLCDARPRTAREGHPPLRPRARRLDDRRARPSSASTPIAPPAASASGSARARTRPRSARSASA